MAYGNDEVMTAIANLNQETDTYNSFNYGAANSHTLNSNDATTIAWRNKLIDLSSHTRWYVKSEGQNLFSKLHYQVSRLTSDIPLELLTLENLRIKNTMGLTPLSLALE